MGLTALAFIIALRVVMADAPASPDISTHTRPLGRKAMLVAKAVFLLLGVVLPWMLGDAWLWRGFALTQSELLSLLAASALWVGLVVAWGMALAALARSWAQLAVLVLGFLFLIMGLGLPISGSSQRWLCTWLAKAALATGLPMLTGIHLPLIIALVLAITAWLVQSLRLGGRLGAGLAIASLASQSLSDGWLNSASDWLRFPELHYTGPTLSLSTGTAKPSATDKTQALWPTLGVHGLPANHLASVLSLAPADSDPVWLRLKARRNNKPDFWTDTDGSDGRYTRLLEQGRMIAGHFAATDLWFDDLSHHQRRDLRSLIGKDAPTAPWRLRLGIYEMRCMFDRPLTDFIAKSSEITLPNGWLLTFEPIREEHYPLLPMRTRHLMSQVGIAPAEHRDPYMSPQPPFSEMCVVVHDPETRENTLVRINSGDPTVNRGSAFITDEDWGREFSLPKPKARMELTGQRYEDWQKQARVQLWLPEERGTVEFVLSLADLQRILAK